MLLLAVVFLVVPFLELYVIVQVAQGIGVPETILLLIAISLTGAWLAKLSGLSVLQRLQRTVRAGRMPSSELVDGGLVLFAGALMVTPGFLTDLLALTLLLPPTRAVIRGSILRRLREGGILRVVVGAPGDADRSAWDVDAWEDPPGRPPLSP